MDNKSPILDSDDGGCRIEVPSIIVGMNFSIAEQFLIEADPILGEVIQRNGDLVPRPQRSYYEALARSIIGQQISVRAAANIFARFEQVTELRPEFAVELSAEQIKLIGLSGQKASYLQDLARHFVTDPAVYDHLDTLDDQAVVDELTRVKGIGVWTAQMFLMFTLRRPDVFAPGDRGLQLAIERLYNLPAKTSQSQLEVFAERWQPHRTTASLHLWQSLNNTPDSAS